MHYPQFEEKNIPSVQFNRASEYWNKVSLVAKFRGGRLTQEWQNYKWSEGALECEKVVTAYRMLGLRPGDKVAILGKNRPRWISSCIAAITAGLTVVTVYPTLTAEEIEYILNDSQAKLLVADEAEQVRKVISKIDNLPNLQKIFVMDPYEDRSDERVAPYDDLLVMADGKVDMEPVFDLVRELDGETVAAIIYTSGTTGPPKGVMLTHNNFLSQRVVQPVFKLAPSDVFLNHLPFCHSFGLTADLLASAEVGATLAISEGIKPEQMRRSLTTIRPTVLMSVPRLFEKLFIQVHQVVRSKPQKVQKLFHGALATGKEVFDCKNEGRPIPFTLGLKYKLAKRILMKVKEQAGLDRVRVAYAGGGPTSKELCYFFQSLGIDIYQGYGLTETSPVANVNIPGRNKLGTVGPPIKGIEEKIAEDGEILIRGPNVMKGYLNKPEATKEAIDEDGWFYTGDIGRFDEDGYLKITDRKKELIITSGGKNIPPLLIETAFNTEPYIEKVAVIGDGRKFLSLLVCPNFELVREWAKGKGLPDGTNAELVAMPEVKELMEQRVALINQQFARFEQIKKIAVIDHVFSEETGELTPTEKLKRRIIGEKYKDIIDDFYPKD